MDEAEAAAAERGRRFLAQWRDHLDRRALLHCAFFFMCNAAWGLVRFAGNPRSSSSSVAAEDVLALFAFWIVSLLIFLIFLVLPEEAAWIVADALYEFFRNRIQAVLLAR